MATVHGRGHNKT